MKTVDIKRNWYLANIDGKILGRGASKFSSLLQGKHKSNYAPNKDDGDYIVIVNAEKVAFSGSKIEQKRYYKHTGTIGNLKVDQLSKLMEKDPERVIRHAVYLMLPKNKLRRKMISRLKIYKGNEHPHQNVKFINIEL